MRKTKKPINTMLFATAVMNILTNMTVSMNASMVSNTTAGNGTMTRKRANGSISAQVVRRIENNEGM